MMQTFVSLGESNLHLLRLSSALRQRCRETLFYATNRLATILGNDVVDTVRFIQANQFPTRIYSLHKTRRALLS